MHKAPVNARHSLLFDGQSSLTLPHYQRVLKRCAETIVGKRIDVTTSRRRTDRRIHRSYKLTKARRLPLFALPFDEDGSKSSLLF